MCDLERNGMKKDCVRCEGCFFEAFTMCPDRDENMTQEVFDELYYNEDWEE